MVPTVGLVLRLVGHAMTPMHRLVSHVMAPSVVRGSLADTGMWPIHNTLHETDNSCIYKHESALSLLRFVTHPKQPTTHKTLLQGLSRWSNATRQVYGGPMRCSILLRKDTRNIPKHIKTRPHLPVPSAASCSGSCGSADWTTGPAPSEQSPNAFQSAQAGDPR